LFLPESGVAVSAVLAGARAPTILVVDDSVSVRQLTASVLRREGFVVLEAVHGREGLDTALREQPDVILCDIHMPVLGMVGPGERSPEQRIARTTPVLMLTSDNDRVSVRRAMAAGADDYLTKPCDAGRVALRCHFLARKSQPLQGGCRPCPGAAALCGTGDHSA